MTQELKTVKNYLDQLLENDSFTDEFLNGLQVDSGNSKISKVAAAVDSGLSIIEKAIAEQADLLIVHHGIFTNIPVRLTGIIAKKLQLLTKNGCSFYTSHLPLDGNLVVGNAAELARYLNLQQITDCFFFNNKPVGVKALVEQPCILEDFLGALKNITGAITPTILPFGKKQISTVGIVTGSGSSAIVDCAELGIDLLISGEPKQSAYHLAKELQVNAIFAGHYATETFGVRAVLKRLEQDLKLSTVFIDEPTGI